MLVKINLTHIRYNEDIDANRLQITVTTLAAKLNMGSDLYVVNVWSSFGKTWPIPSCCVNIASPCHA